MDIDILNEKNQEAQNIIKDRMNTILSLKTLFSNSLSRYSTDSVKKFLRFTIGIIIIIGLLYFTESILTNYIKLFEYVNDEFAQINNFGQATLYGLVVFLVIMSIKNLSSVYKTLYIKSKMRKLHQLYDYLDDNLNELPTLHDKIINSKKITLSPHYNVDQMIHKNKEKYNHLDHETKKGFKIIDKGVFILSSLLISVYIGFVVSGALTNVIDKNYQVDNIDLFRYFLLANSFLGAIGYAFFNNRGVNLFNYILVLLCSILGVYLMYRLISKALSRENKRRLASAYIYALSTRALPILIYFMVGLSYPNFGIILAPGLFSLIIKNPNHIENRWTRSIFLANILLPLLYGFFYTGTEFNFFSKNFTVNNNTVLGIYIVLGLFAFFGHIKTIKKPKVVEEAE